MLAPIRPSTTNSAQLRHHPRLRELAGYLAGSAAALLLDVGLLVVLVEVAGWHYLLAAAVGFCAGAVLLYLLSIHAIFRQRRWRQRAGLEFGAFFAIGVVGLLLTQAGLALGVEVFKLPYPWAKLITVAAVFWFNYLSRWLLLFSTPERRAPAHPVQEHTS